MQLFNQNGLRPRRDYSKLAGAALEAAFVFKTGGLAGLAISALSHTAGTTADMMMTPVFSRPNNLRMMPQPEKTMKPVEEMQLVDDENDPAIIAWEMRKASSPRMAAMRPVPRKVWRKVLAHAQAA